jgi:hypothetical protein
MTFRTNPPSSFNILKHKMTFIPAESLLVTCLIIVFSETIAVFLTTTFVDDVTFLKKPCSNCLINLNAHLKLVLEFKI